MLPNPTPPSHSEAQPKRLDGLWVCETCGRRVRFENVSAISLSCSDHGLMVRENAASPKEPTPDLSDEREFTILVCPECGEQSSFSGMDAVHGVEARCYSHGLEEVEDEHGKHMRVKPGPELVAVTVVPKSRLSALSAENELRALTQRIKSFLGHRGGCAAYKPSKDKGPCDCGLTELRSALAPNTPEEDSP